MGIKVNLALTLFSDKNSIPHTINPNKSKCPPNSHERLNVNSPEDDMTPHEEEEPLTRSDFLLYLWKTELSVVFPH